MKTFFRITALLLSAVLAGCGGGGGTAGNEPAEFASRLAKSPQATTPQTGAGSIRVSLSGANDCGLDHAWVTVQAIRIYGDAAADADSSPSELTLSSPRRIDLVGLTGGLLAELGTTALPAGHYRALRLVLVENGRGGTPDALANAVQVKGASPTPLAAPAGAQSGIKVRVDFDVAVGQVADLVLGLDPCTSVVWAGNSGRYILKPVITAAPREQGFFAQPARLVATGVQSSSWLEPLANGGYLAVWNDAAGVHAQRYGPGGTTDGGESLLYEGAPASALTKLVSGGFVMALPAPFTVPPGAIPGSAVWALHLDPSGTPAGSAQIVFRESYPYLVAVNEIDALPDGGYLITGAIRSQHPRGGESYFVQRFDATGTRLGDSISVGSRYGATGRAQTSVLPSGGWLSLTTAIDHPLAPRPFYNIKGVVRLFDGVDEPVASTTIDPYPGADEWPDAAAGLKDGNHVVAWHVRPFVDGLTLPQLQLQVFGQTGSPVSAVVDFDPPVNAGSVKLTALADGGFLLTTGVPPEWEGSVFTVLGQYFDATGQARGSMFELGTSRHTYGLAASADGGFVFTSRAPAAGAVDDVHETQFTRAGRWTRASSRPIMGPASLPAPAAP